MGRIVVVSSLFRPLLLWRIFSRSLVCSFPARALGSNATVHHRASPIYCSWCLRACFSKKAFNETGWACRVHDLPSKTKGSPRHQERQIMQECEKRTGESRCAFVAYAIALPIQHGPALNTSTASRTNPASSWSGIFVYLQGLKGGKYLLVPTLFCL